MSSKDLISKQLLKRLLVDFGVQLFKLDIVDADLLSNEQPRVEGKRADLVARVRNTQGASYILHVEVQNDNRTDVPLRMLRYYSDLALEHAGEEIKQYLLYIGKAALTMPDHVQTSEWRYCYKILDMRSQDSDDFLHSNNPDALVLAILCDPKGREPGALVAHIVNELRRLHGPKLDSLRDSLAMLDILASNRDLQNMVKESYDMLIEVEKLGSYQLGMEKGLVQGIEQGLVQGMEQGLVQGIEQGMVQGIEQGMVQGMEQGSERSQQEIVLNLLSRLSPEQAAEFSGVALDKVNAIAASKKAPGKRQ